MNKGFRTFSLLWGMALLVGLSSTFIYAAEQNSTNDEQFRSQSIPELVKLINNGTSKDGSRKEKGAFERAHKALYFLLRNITPEVRAGLKEMLFTYGLDHVVKIAILQDLGMAGSKEDIDLITDFEIWTKRTSETPPPFRPYFGGYGQNGSVHGENYTRVVGDFSDSKSQHWIALAWFRGIDALWVTKQLNDTNWSNPILIAFGRNYENTKISGGPDVFDIEMFGGLLRQAKLEEALKDSDNDGLPDMQEKWMGTNPDNPDSDDDGIIDGKDSNPITPVSKNPNDDIHAIRQAAFTIMVATHWERVPIYLWAQEGSGLREDPQEFYGYCGPVLWTEERVESKANVNNLRVTIRSAEEATVRIGFSYMPCSGSGYDFVVMKKYGKWVVTKSFGGWVE